jgi:hypothetical protein
MTVRCSVRPRLPVARRAFVARRDLVIRRLIRPVRPGPVESFAQVDRSEPSAAGRWRPTSWVHDGYTPVRLVTPCLQTVRLEVVMPPALVLGVRRRASVDLVRPMRVARPWPGRACLRSTPERSHESLRDGARAGRKG